MGFPQPVDVRFSFMGTRQPADTESFSARIDQSSRPARRHQSEGRETLRMAIKITVAGLGARGQDWVREVRAARGFELAACVDNDPAALQRASARFGISSDQCFSNLERALDKSGSQAVIVATPPDCHVTACQPALDRKLALLVEKPFTLQLSEAVRLVAQADANGTPLLVAQNYRYRRSFRTVKRLIDEGLLGRVGMVVCQYYRPFHNMPETLAKLPNSVLWGMSVHHLDAIRYVLGAKVISLNAETFTLPWGRLPRGASL